MSREIHVVLVHHPVLAKDGGIVTSTITNLDVHDIARTVRTYGCLSYVLVHPVVAQRKLVETICEHWTTGSSADRIPSRKNALALVRTVESLEAFYESLGGRDGVDVWTTSARPDGTTTYSSGRALLERAGRPVALLFGTSWGLPAEVIQSADVCLEPIAGKDGFNHLSVRAACAISLERLLG